MREYNCKKIITCPPVKPHEREGEEKEGERKGGEGKRQRNEGRKKGRREEEKMLMMKF